MQYPQPYPPFPSPPPEPRKFGLLSALFLSFFSAELYRDIARGWRGIGVGYLLLLMIVTGIPMAIAAHISFNHFAREEASAMIATFPSIKITKGKASSDSDPYIWVDPKSKQPILYVDTSGKFDQPQGQNAVAKLSETSLVIKKSPSETQTYALAPTMNFSIDKNDLARWLDAATHWVGLVVFGGWWIGGSIWHVIQILIYGVAGLIFCSMFGARLTYGALLRLSAVAITPAMFIGVGIDLAGVQVPYVGWIYFFIEMGFLMFAVHANASVTSTPGGFPMSPYGQTSPYAPPTPGGYPPPGYPAPGQPFPPPGQLPSQR